MEDRDFEINEYYGLKLLDTCASFAYRWKDKVQESLLKFLKLREMHLRYPDCRYDDILHKIEKENSKNQSSLLVSASLKLCKAFHAYGENQFLSKLLIAVDGLLKGIPGKQDKTVENSFLNSCFLFDDELDLTLGLCSCYMRFKLHQEAVDVALKSLNRFQDKEAKLYWVLAYSFKQLKDFSKALIYNYKLLETCRSMKEEDIEKLGWNNQNECQTLFDLSSCFDYIGDKQSALKFAEEYLRVVRFSSQDNLVQIFSYVGGLQYSLHDFSSAFSSHSTELEICKKYRDRKGIAKAYGNLGLVYSAMGKTAIANEYLNQELRIVKMLGSSELEIDSMRKLCMAKMQQGDASSIDCFKELYQLAKESHSWKTQCFAYLNLGKLYQQKGTLNFARHYLEQGMHRARDLEMQAEAIDAEMHLAQVLKILGYYEDARRHFKNVVLYFKNILDTLHCFEIIIDNEVVTKLEKSCKDLQEVLVKLDCWQDAFEIAELCHSRIYLNILRKKRATVVGHPVADDVPRTTSEITQSLKTLPRNAIILCFTVTEEGFLLWMLKPEKGVTKFVKQNSLASHPINQLVRDCMKSLGISKKGGHCCYQTNFRQDIGSKVYAKNNSKNLPNPSSKLKKNDGISVKTEKITLEGKKMAELSDIGESPNDKSMLASNNDFDSDSIHEQHSDVKSCCLEDEDSIDTDETEETCHAKEQTDDSGYQEDLNKRLKEIRNTAPDSPSTDCHENNTYDSIFAESSGSRTSRSSTIAESIAEEHSHRKMLQELFNLLLGKLEHLLISSNKNNSLVIIPDGTLNMVPFHLLIDKNGIALHERFRLSVLPCLALLAIDSLQECSGNSLVYGNPCLKDAGICNINGDVLTYETENAEQELSLVSGVLGSGQCSGKAASKENFMKLAPNNDVIHVSTLGCVGKSWLLFSPDSHREQKVADPNSFIFNIEDLAQLQINASLVVVSACNQCPHGVGDSPVYEYHLATGLLAAGARAVVMFLFAVPHKMLMVIIHKLYRLLEEGRSVSDSLQVIYNSMSCSEDYSHPGYWGGIIHLGRDSNVNIVNIRKTALEKSVDKEKELVLKAMIDESCDDPNESKILFDAELFKSTLASLLTVENSGVAMQTLKELLEATVELLTKFSRSNNKLPAVAVNQDVLKLSEMSEILQQLGFKTQPALFESEATYVMLPYYDFDNYLGYALRAVTSICGITSLSKTATFYLSKALPIMTDASLQTLLHMINSAQRKQEVQLRLNDINLQRLWVANQPNVFLQEIGFYAVGENILLHSDETYKQLQNHTRELASALLLLYQTNENVTKSISRIKSPSSKKLCTFSPWLSLKQKREEIITKHMLADSLHRTNRKFNMLQRRGRQWHEATVKSWTSPECHKLRIGPKTESIESCQRISDGFVKLKVKPGGTPSSVRFPIVEKPKVSKYQCHELREKSENAFIDHVDKLSSRKRYEVCKSFKGC